jgi:hypothetical protein
MSNHPLSPWLDLVRAALPAFRQAGADVPAAQAQWAQHVQSALELRKEFSALQGATSFALLQMQLAMLGTGSPAKTMHALIDVQADTVTQLFGQSKALSEQLATRAGACIDDLRNSQGQDDVSFVLAGFMRDAEGATRKAADGAGLLLNSANAALDALVHRCLHEMTSAPAAPTTD